jgi:hypothetical protein
MDSEQFKRLDFLNTRLLIWQRLLQQAQVRNDLPALQKQYDEPGSLVPFGFKAFSQNDEDGIIREIYRRIGTTDKSFVEIGAGTGLVNNTLFLLFQGWKGLWVDASDSIDEAIAHYSDPIARGQLTIRKAMVTPDTVDSLIRENVSGEGLDLLSMDIDGNDFHVLDAIRCVEPRSIVVEYNAKFPPPVRYCMRYDENHSWDGSDHFGASLKWYEVKLAERGYWLVGCNITGTNAFFVREDLTGDKFLRPFTAEKHYQPARYEMSQFMCDLSGHPTSYRTLPNAILEEPS